MENNTKKIILITGGGSGIGKACATIFAANGSIVYILGRNEDKLKSTVSEITSYGKVNYIQADITSVADCERAIASLIECEGRLDVLVNCAGVTKAGPSIDMTEAIWNTIIDTNLKGTFFMSKFAIPELIKTKGSIVNISSDSGVAGNSELAIYCASKGGINMLTKSLALELAPLGVRVNAVCPTETDTDMAVTDAIEYGYSSKEEYAAQLKYIYPQCEEARLVRPEEVAEAVYFLADNKKASAITGTTLMVDFGITAGY